MCPWSGFEPGTISFCEERLCAWVVEPSNAWSSVAYVLVGLALLGRFREPLLRQVAVAGILIGVGSFAFHGTGTFVGELLDISGMLMLSGLMLSQAWGRLSGLTAREVALRWGALTLGGVAVVLVVKPSGIPLFAAQLVATIIAELYLWHRRSTVEIRRFLYALSMTASAFFIWVLDISGVACSPGNHFVTGHAVWHVLNAGAVGMLCFFYHHAGVGRPSLEAPSV